MPASLTTTLSASAKVVEVADVSPSTMLSSVTVDVIPSSALISAAVAVTPSIILSSAAVAVIAVPLKLIPSKYAIPSTYKSFHSCEELPKSYVLSVLGIMFELTSAPKTTLSSAASPNVSVPPLKVVVPVTVRLPPTETLPVVVIESIYASFQYSEEVPKSTSLSVTGANTPSDNLICSTAALETST